VASGHNGRIEGSWTELTVVRYPITPWIP